MKKINVLPSEIFDLFAKGEVAENPAAVVKECVENSLDAGATRIGIVIERGGLGLIQVTDNGSGVESTEIEKVFLPHATSKIENAGNLERIATLGFRGEALSSIAAVSRATFITRTGVDSTAVKLVIEAGKIMSQIPVGAPIGTSIAITNLFYNDPERKSSLSSADIEKNNVTDVVGNLILSNPAVSFKYTADNETIYDFHGKSLIDAIKAVFGNAASNDLITINAESDKFRLTGYVSNLSLQSAVAHNQTLVVNGRVVESGIVGDAVNDAFANDTNDTTMGNFPFFVLNLAVDFACTDVNVHPRKEQIKFSDEQEISEFVRRAVTEADSRAI